MLFNQIIFSRIGTQRYFFRNLVNPKPNLDCNYTIPIDLAPNGVPFGAKSIEKV